MPHRPVANGVANVNVGSPHELDTIELGDRVIKGTGTSRREGEIRAVLGIGDKVHYKVQWDEMHDLNLKHDTVTIMHRFKESGGSRPAIFTLQLVFLAVLGGLAYAYFFTPQVFGGHTTLGPTPIAVPWFGALGAVLISITGVVEHPHDWDPSNRFWHWVRPFIGASLGVISVLILQAGILAVGNAPNANPAPPSNLLYYLLAFLVGYREETFRELIKRLTDVVLGPGGAPGKAPTISSVNPIKGKAGGGETVLIVGENLADTQSIKFGSNPASFKVDGDSQITASTPQGTPRLDVPVVVTTKAGSVSAGTFSYTGQS
jgi:hypothetical protein